MNRTILLLLGLALSLPAFPGLALAVNILVNPDFESGALSPWYQAADYGGGEDWNVTSADVHSGQYSVTDAGNKLIAQDFAAVPVSLIFEASFWLRNNDASINTVYFRYSDNTTEENFWKPTADGTS